MIYYKNENLFRTSARLDCNVYIHLLTQNISLFLLQFFYCIILKNNELMNCNS